MTVLKLEGRRKPWAVDWRDGKRRFRRFFKTREQAIEFSDQEKARRVNVRNVDTTLDPYCTLRDYVPRFLKEAKAAEVSEATLTRYRIALDRHILTAPVGEKKVLGDLKVRDIDRATIRSFRHAKLEELASVQGQKKDQTPRKRLKKGTVRQLVATLSAILGLAVDDGIILHNPALRSERRRRTKAAKAHAKAVKVKALTAEESSRLFSTAREVEPEVYPALMLMGLGGLRSGESLGLRWNSVDLDAGQLRIHEQLKDASTKTGEERMVEIAPPLAELLTEMRATRRKDALAAGRDLGSEHVVFPWLSDRPDATEQQRAIKRVQRGMTRALRAAGVSTRIGKKHEDEHTPHDLRHTFCSLALAEGHPPRWVQAQAGHASLEMTVKVYGSWMPPKAPGAMARLGRLMVTGRGEVVTNSDVSLVR